MNVSAPSTRTARKITPCPHCGVGGEQTVLVARMVNGRVTAVRRQCTSCAPDASDEFVLTQLKEQ